MSDRILIVGAGPTGLVMACELLTLGLPCRIIDRLEKPVSTSRSFTIHARTLELLDKLGLAEEFIARGHKSYSMDYHFQGKDEIPKLDFTEIESVYPFCLIINQQDTEAILREHLSRLGGVIEWNTRLESLEIADDGTVTTTLVNTQTEATEISQWDWLIGCDGFYSTVRRSLNLPFDGHEYSGEMKMMDVAVSGYPFGEHSISYFINKDHMLLITKLPGQNYRVLISDTGQGATTETAREDFQRVVDLHFGGNVSLAEPEWTTVFKIARRKSDTYRVSSVFLAGDAAHVNSPAGGQGMNVSMQDAFNLAWKLAMVVQGRAKSALLDSYEQERLPIAKQMHEGTQFLHSIIMAHGKGMEERIALTQAPGWNRKAVNQIAGIAYTYRADGDEAVICTGDRAPNVLLADGQTLYNHIDRTVPTLLVLLPVDAGDADYQDARQLAGDLSQHYPITAKVVITPGAAADEDAVVDADGMLHSLYGAAEGVKLCLIRPDRYIGFYDDSLDALNSHLESLFVAGNSN